MVKVGNATLTARSVLASALLGADPPDLPVAHLVRLAGLFGINENSARVALSRMVTTGEAENDGAGRYRISGHLLDRRARQQASVAGTTGPWDGSWHLVVVTTSGSTAETRARRRHSLSFARLAELREGVWMRPANLELVLADETRPDVTCFRARPEDSRAVVARLWDLEGWRKEAETLLAGLAELDPGDPANLAPGFVLSAAVLRHLQHDPLLPPALAPPGWPGTALRRRYAGWDRRYRDLLTRWGRRQA